MHIALLQPEVPQSKDEYLLGMYPPLGLMWLAGNTEHTIEIIDLRCQPVTIKEWDIVGITCQTVSLKTCADIAWKIRDALPEAVIVTGGHHPVIILYLVSFFNFLIMSYGEREKLLLLSCSITYKKV